MIYTTMFSCYAAFSWRRSLAFRIALAVGLVGLAIFITAYYHFIKDPLFHQRAYALLTATVLLRSMYMMETHLRPYWKNRLDPARRDASKATPLELREAQRQDERDLRILTLMWRMVGYGLSVFLGGFAIWQLDNVYCGTLRRWRKEVGLPWGIFLEGHGWW